MRATQAPCLSHLVNDMSANGIRSGCAHSERRRAVAVPGYYVRVHLGLSGSLAGLLPAVARAGPANERDVAVVSAVRFAPFDARIDTT